MATSYVVKTTFKADDNLTASLARMSAAAGVTDKRMDMLRRSVLSTRAAMAGMGRAAINIGTYGAVAAAGIGALGVAAANSRAEMAAHAETLGMNVNTMGALTKLIEPMGLNFEHVSDQIEELRNAFGEFSGLDFDFKKFREPMKMLGLDPKKMQELGKRDINALYEVIMDAAAKNNDKIKATAAIDILFGGEGQRIVSAVQKSGKSIRELRTDYERLIFSTQRGDRDWQRFLGTFRDVSLQVRSLGGEFTSRLGGAMEPVLRRFSDFLVINKEIINLKMDEYVTRFGNALASADWEGIAARMQEVGGAFLTIGSAAASALVAAADFTSWIDKNVVKPTSEATGISEGNVWLGGIGAFLARNRVMSVARAGIGVAKRNPYVTASLIGASGLYGASKWMEGRFVDPSIEEDPYTRMARSQSNYERIMADFDASKGRGKRIPKDVYFSTQTMDLYSRITDAESSRRQGALGVNFDPVNLKFNLEQGAQNMAQMVSDAVAKQLQGGLNITFTVNGSGASAIENIQFNPTAGIIGNTSPLIVNANTGK